MHSNKLYVRRTDEGYEYSLLPPDKFGRGKSLGSVGRLAKRLRKLGAEAFFKKLPDLPLDFRGVIEEVAAGQEEWIANLGKEDLVGVGDWDAEG